VGLLSSLNCILLSKPIILNNYLNVLQEEFPINAYINVCALSLFRSLPPTEEIVKEILELFGVGPYHLTLSIKSSPY
jgi:hypothetical protein